MGIRERYENGVFCWVELATSDLPGAKEFYGKLFQWSFQDFPADNGSPYTMALKNDRSVCGLFPMTEAMIGQNLPPHWETYINVTDLGAAIEAWQQQGGTVLQPPFTVMEYGRMAVVQDPTGAVVSLWEAHSHIGAGVVNEVNTFCWTELQTRGAEQAAAFYRSVFGWEVDIDEKPPYYVTCKVQGHPSCGMFDMDKVNLPPEVPTNWSVYFHVENLDTAIGIVNNSGGKTLMGPIPIEPGRFATVADPQGAVLALIELQVVDD